VILSGLDLGTAKNYTALACADRLPLANPTPKRRWCYEVVHLETWELGTSYVVLADKVQKRYEHPKLAGSVLVPDYTGVGRPVFDVLKSKRVRARMVPVLTTSGKLAHEEKETGVWHVPKIELVSTLQVLLQGEFIKIDPRLNLAERIKKELTEFRVMITKSRNETFGAEASQQDDLVFALMLLCWLGERDGGGTASGIGTPKVGEGNMTEAAGEGVFLT
jgi:hypothetical protein